MPKKPIYRQLKNFSNEKSDVPVLISGTLGVQINGLKTVEVLGRDGFVWVKLRDSQSELIQVYNAVVSPIYGLPVLVTRQNNRYTIYGRDINQYQDWGNSPYLPKHGTQHSFAPEIGLGGDVTWVYSRQFMPMLAMPSGSTGAGNLIVNPYIYHNTSGTFSYIGNTGTPVVTVAKPTNNTARMMLLYWDEPSGRPSFYTGSTFSSLLTGSSDIVPFIPYLNDTTKIPLAAIRLVSGTTNITWDNIYDVRPFFSAAIGGGGTGNVTVPVTGTVVVWDEGIPKGSVTTLNFVGNNVDVSVSGSIARVFVTGSTSSSGPSSSYDDFWTSGSSGRGIISKFNSNDAVGDAAFAIGQGSLASGTASYAEGQGNVAYGTAAHVQGAGNKAVGYSSHVGGSGNIASGSLSAVLAGSGNTVTESNSSVIAGAGIQANVANTAYTQFFNTKLRSGTVASPVAIDPGGFLVTGSTDGWNPIFAVPTSGALGSPVFDITFNRDMTGILGLGDRIKVTQSTDKYFIVVKVGSYSSGTTAISCYGGTDYTLVASSGTAITNPYFSHSKTPFGFPPDPLKWTVSVSDSNRNQKTTPTLSTWYGGSGLSSTGPSINIPIGAWRVEYRALVDEMDTAATDYNIWSTLSTANNSESDTDFTSIVILTAPSGAYKIWNTVFIGKHLTLTTKTTYYLNIRCTAAGTTPDSIDIRGDVVPTLIRAICAYL